MVGGPRYLRVEGDPPAEEHVEVEVQVTKPATVTLPPPRDATCIVCDAGECSPAYALLEHSPFTIDRRYKLMRSESIVRSLLAPHVFALCASCHRRLRANRARVRIARGLALLGAATGSGYMIAAMVKDVSVAWLFGAFGLILAMAVVIALSDRSLRKALRVPALPGMNVVAFSRDREDILRVLERSQLRSREIQAELQRGASAAVPLPRARVR